MNFFDSSSKEWIRQFLNKTTNSSSPASSGPGSNKLASTVDWIKQFLNKAAKNFSSPDYSLETQYSFFVIEEEDLQIVKSNKEKITQLMKMLEEKELLVPSSFKNYEKKDFFSGGQGTVYKVVEKKEHASHLNPDGSYFGGKYLALKVEDFFLGNKLEIKLRELELMTHKFHKSAIQAEKVFFGYDPETLRHFINIVMPWYNHTLVSWMLKETNNKGHISDIKNNKRRFAEVRRVLTTVLEGISAMHSGGYVHMDIKPNNILVNEHMNESDDENVEYKPLLMSEPMIADFGMVKDLTKETSSSSFTGFTIEYAAPEVCPPSKPLVSPKADIYSFGVILYKIFVDENEDSFRSRLSNPKLAINSTNIKKRIEIMFPKDKNTIPDSMINDIAKIINISLEYKLELRPQASALLQEHEFFKISQKELSKVSYFEIENTFEYGLNLLEGKNGYPKDFKKSREIFEKLSNSFNHMPSRYFFGFMVYHGLGGDMNEKIGDEIMEQSATTAKNYFDSHCDDPLGFSEFAIGHMYDCGHGVAEDCSKSLEFFQKSSNKENSFSQSFFGLVHQLGEGVEKNLSLAFDSFKKSALQGNCIGQLALGASIQEEQQDSKKAFKWLKLSAEQGLPASEAAIGSFYDNGHGVAIDKEKAVYHYKLAAEKGLADAQFIFADKLERGEGIETDLDAAIEYYWKAAEQGFEEATKALERLIK